jgi:hypothetical protein
VCNANRWRTHFARTNNGARQGGSSLPVSACARTLNSPPQIAIVIIIDVVIINGDVVVINGDVVVINGNVVIINDDVVVNVVVINVVDINVDVINVDVVVINVTSLS